MPPKPTPSRDAMYVRDFFLAFWPASPGCAAVDRARAARADLSRQRVVAFLRATHAGDSLEGGGGECSKHVCCGSLAHRASLGSVYVPGACRQLTPVACAGECLRTIVWSERRRRSRNRSPAASDSSQLATNAWPAPRDGIRNGRSVQRATACCARSEVVVGTATHMHGLGPWRAGACSMTSEGTAFATLAGDEPCCTADRFQRAGRQEGQTRRAHRNSEWYSDCISH